MMEHKANNNPTSSYYYDFQRPLKTLIIDVVRRVQAECCVSLVRGIKKCGGATSSCYVILRIWRSASKLSWVRIQSPSHFPGFTQMCMLVLTPQYKQLGCEISLELPPLPPPPLFMTLVVWCGGVLIISLQKWLLDGKWLVKKRGLPQYWLFPFCTL